MTIKFRRAVGAVISSCALIVAGLTAPATAQALTPTSWTEFNVDGQRFFLLTEQADTVNPITDATGTLTGTVKITPRATRFLTVLGNSADLEVFHDEYHGDDVIGVPSIHSADPEFDGFGEILSGFSDTWGEYGEYGMDWHYSGDGTYTAANLSERRMFSPPAGKVVPTSVLSVPAGGSPLEVRLSPAINGTGEFECAPLSLIHDLGEDYEPIPATVTNGQATATCDLGDPGEPHVMGFRLDASATHTAHVNLMVFIPEQGGTTAGIDPATALAPGQQVTVTASDLDPNSTYEVVVESTPVTVGQLTTDGSGSGTAVVTLPDDLTDGQHHLILRKGGSDAVRKAFMLSTLNDPSVPATMVLETDDPGDPSDPGGASGSLTGSLGS